MAGADVFFSSCFEDPLHQRLNIRDRVARELNTPNDRRVWLAEDFQVLKPDSGAPALEKALFCVEGVREASVYVAVARSRHGSGVEVMPSRQVQASYFELELFEAALLSKPAHVFLLKGDEPEPRLHSLLKLLEPALPGLCWTPLDEDEIFARVSGIVETQANARKRAGGDRVRASASSLANQLTDHRHRVYDPVAELPDLQFLGGFSDPAITPPDPTLVEGVLARARDEPNHNVRLTLLWMAIRELMGAPPDKVGAEAFRELWSQALATWNSTGAWYGLHGHILMGCLGALGSLSRIRALEGRQSETPHGPMASEYYSIAKRVGRRDLRASVLEMAKRHVDASFLGGETSGKLALRGSVYKALGRNSDAIADYERTLALRLGAEDASQQEIGDAMSELGFALVFAGRIRRGLAMMEEGVARLEGGASSGFLVRAKRKLGRAYLVAAAPFRALETLAEAHEIATQYDFLDQVGQIDRLAAAAERRIARLRRKHL